MKPWTTSELQYLADHAAEGADAIAEAIGRTPRAVQQTAHLYGISLRQRWTCPRCTATVYSPLSPVTGWCRACSMNAARDKTLQQVAEMREELARIEDAERSRQAAYSAKSRAKIATRQNTMNNS